MANDGCSLVDDGQQTTISGDGWGGQTRAAVVQEQQVEVNNNSSGSHGGGEWKWL